MIRFLFISVLGLCLSACGNEPFEYVVEKPANLMPKEKLIDVLTEVTIIEAAHQMKYIQVGRYSTILQNECDSLFKEKNTDKEAFEASMRYYSLQIKVMKKIYESVNNEIAKRKSELVIEPTEDSGNANDSIVTVSSGGIRDRSFHKMEGETNQ